MVSHFDFNAMLISKRFDNSCNDQDIAFIRLIKRMIRKCILYRLFLIEQPIYNI